MSTVAASPIAAASGASAILAGVVGATMAASDDAKAADGTERSAGDRARDAAITGGAAGGTAYGATTKAAPYIVKQLARSLLGRAVIRAVPPAAAGLTAYDVGNAVLGGLRHGENAEGADLELRQGNPQFFAQQEALRRGAYGEEADLQMPYYGDAPMPDEPGAPEPYYGDTVIPEEGAEPAELTPRTAAGEDRRGAAAPDHECAHERRGGAAQCPAAAGRGIADPPIRPAADERDGLLILSSSAFGTPMGSVRLAFQGYSCLGAVKAGDRFLAVSWFPGRARLHLATVSPARSQCDAYLAPRKAPLPRVPSMHLGRDVICCLSFSLVATQWTVASSSSPNGVSKPFTSSPTRSNRAAV